MTADPARMVEHIRIQARACAELGSPLYAALLHRLADDVVSGGASAVVLAGHEEDRGPSALALRLMGGVHRLVLDGRAPELARYFPSVGGTADSEAAWPALREVLVGHRDVLRAFLDQPPQTNEVGRASALLGGLHLIADSHARPIRLVEIGTSAGLLLRSDRFRVELMDGRSFGPEQSPVVLRDAWRGWLPPLAEGLQVVERVGCDTAPLDPTTEDGRLTLTSYVWPDQVERLDRLRGAFEVAATVPATVVRSRAAAFLDSLDLVAGTTTVVWHSVMWQYLPAAEQNRVSQRIDELGALATADAGLARLSLEPRRPAPGAEHVFQVRLQVWPGGSERLLGSAAPHGIPTTWDSPTDGG
jgi:hypothetical protein